MVSFNHGSTCLPVQLSDPFPAATDLPSLKGQLAQVGCPGFMKAQHYPNTGLHKGVQT